MCQVFGKKVKMPNFPLPYFIASPSTDWIWQVPFHASQTHRPPRLRSNGPRWLLRDWITDALMEQLTFLELLPRAGMGRQGCSAFLDIDSLYQRLGSSGPMPYCDKAPKFRASSCARGSCLIPYLCWFKSPQHYMTDKATSGYSPMNGQVTREGTLHP